MVELEIDGKKITIEEGASIIEAADKEGIYIPRFCYHQKLSIAANCRMCLVEVEKSPKPIPACATPVTQDMKVFTKSDVALAAQRAVMEYLLINHPLDCPICDQGGSCELQDLAMGFGDPYSYYEEGKRSFYNDDLGPLIATEMTRCIQCTRCVRFGEEIAGMRELGVTHRGENEFISTYIKHFMQSELSGNIIDICPVGALTAKPSRFTIRSWEASEHPTIAPHDCVGSNIFVHTFFQEYHPQRKAYRVVPKQNAKVNEVWISDRDRFSYQGLYHEDRVYQPKIKRSDQWEEADWKTAMYELTDCLKVAVKNFGADQLATLASANATTEELFLLQKITRELGSHNIDHRLREQDFSDQQLLSAYPGLGMPIPELENLDAVLLVGSDIRHEQPLLSHRLNQASQNNAEIFAVNPIDYDFIFPTAEKIIQSDIVSAVAEIVKAAADQKKQTIAELSAITPTEKANQIAAQLLAAEKTGVFLGAFANQHPHASQIRALLHLLSDMAGSTLGILSDGANSAGAWLAGAVPHRGPAGEKLETAGLDAKAMLTTDPRKIYMLFNFEPEFDTAFSEAALHALNEAALVICFTTFVSPEMEQYADFILPISPFTETDGTFVNVAGQWQSFVETSVPMETSKPGWRVLRLLANLLQLEGFNFENAQQITKHLKADVEKMAFDQPKSSQLPALTKASDEYVRLAAWPIYRTDALVRRAQALQQTLPANLASIQINQAMADQLNFLDGLQITAVQGESRLTLPLVINNQLADNVVVIPSGLIETAGFGQASASIRLERESQ